MRNRRSVDHLVSRGILCAVVLALSVTVITGPAYARPESDSRKVAATPSVKEFEELLRFSSAELNAELVSLQKELKEIEAEQRVIRKELQEEKYKARRKNKKIKSIDDEIKALEKKKAELINSVPKVKKLAGKAAKADARVEELSRRRTAVLQLMTAARVKAMEDIKKSQTTSPYSPGQDSPRQGSGQDSGQAGHDEG